MKKADYGKIAVFFDTGRSLQRQNTDWWLELIFKYAKAREGTRVLDLGCGTGRFALPMASRLNYCVVGADSSEEMLTKAREKDTDGLVAWDYQDAQNLTYRDASFDVVFMSHLLHHVDCPVKVLRECKRVLTASGVVIVRYGAIEQIRHDVEHTLFPEVLAIDEARTPTVEVVEKWLSDAGFSGIITEEVIQQTFESSVARLGAAKAKNTSALTMISPEAFEQGILHLSKYVKENPNDPWLLFDRLTLTVGYSSNAT